MRTFAWLEEDEKKAALERAKIEVKAKIAAGKLPSGTNIEQAAQSAVAKVIYADRGEEVVWMDQLLIA